MGETLPKAAALLLLLLCLCSPAIGACSTGPFGGPDPAQAPDAPRGTPVGGAGDPSVSGGSPGGLSIEGARLQTGVEGERIVVVVGHGGYFPECALMEARGGVYGRGTESRWAKAGATERAQIGESYVVVFHEDPRPVVEVADPRKKSYWVLCVEAATKREAAAHVEGTPTAPP